MLVFYNFVIAHWSGIYSADEPFYQSDYKQSWKEVDCLFILQ